MAGFKRKNLLHGRLRPAWGAALSCALPRGSRAVERSDRCAAGGVEPQGGIADPYRLERYQRPRRHRDELQLPSLGGPRPSSLDQEPGEAGTEGSAHLWRADRQFRRGDGPAGAGGTDQDVVLSADCLGDVSLADRPDPVPDRAGVATMVGGAGDRRGAGYRRSDAAAQKAAHAVASTLLYLQRRDRGRRDRSADDGPARGGSPPRYLPNWMGIGTRCFS